jgi:hypothetical protein
VVFASDKLFAFMTVILGEVRVSEAGHASTDAGQEVRYKVYQFDPELRDLEYADPLFTQFLHLLDCNVSEPAHWGDIEYVQTDASIAMRPLRMGHQCSANYNEQIA